MRGPEITMRKTTRRDQVIKKSKPSQYVWKLPDCLLNRVIKVKYIMKSPEGLRGISTKVL